MPRSATSPRRHSRLRAEDVVQTGSATVVQRLYTQTEAGLNWRNGAQSKTISGKTMLDEVRSIFLPAGYPRSVRPEYLTFQLYDTLQAACSYLRSILTTSAILRGAGVGEDSASPMAAAVAWVLRDGVGMFGSLLFSYVVGANFDANVKEWRLFADIINDVGMTLDLLAPLAGSPTGFMVVAALGAACKTICGMVAGATRASITAHFALEGNLADVSAKENAQETAVTLVGLVAGSAIASSMGDAAITAWLAFVVLTAVHVWANCRGVGSLSFDFLNPQRAMLVTKAWCAATEAARRDASVPMHVLSPERISSEERFWGPLVLWMRGPRMAVGISSLIDQRAADGGAAELADLASIFSQQQYLLRVNSSGSLCVALRPSATGETVVKALLHCEAIRSSARLRESNKSVPEKHAGLPKDEKQILKESLKFCEDQWESFTKALLTSGWARTSVRMEHFCGSLRVRIGNND